MNLKIIIIILSIIGFFIFVIIVRKIKLKKKIPIKRPVYYHTTISEEKLNKKVVGYIVKILKGTKKILHKKCESKEEAENIINKFEKE